MATTSDGNSGGNSRDKLLRWRDKILRTVYITGMVAGAFIIVPLVIHLYNLQRWPVIVFDLVVVAWGSFALLFWRRLKYGIKAAGALAVFLFTGIAVLWNLGPSSGGGYWLFSFPVASALLLGMRPAIIATVVNATVLAVFALLLHKNLLVWDLAGIGIEQRFIITALNFVLLNLLTAVSVATLNKLLINSLDKQEEAKFKLELEGRQLRAALAQLHKEKSQNEDAQKALWAEKEMFRALSEESPIGLALCTDSGAVEYINSAFNKIFGYGSEDVPTVGHWLQKAYPDPVARQRAESVWEKSIALGQGGPMPAGVSEVVCKDGSPKQILFRSVGLLSGKRLVLLEDITYRIKSDQDLRRSEERYRLLVQNAPAGIIELDISNNTIAGLNDVALEMIGRPRQKVIGTNPLMWFPEEVHDTLKGKLDELAQGLPLDDSLELEYTKRNDGKKLCLDIAFCSTGEKGRAGIIPVVVNDVTERKAVIQAVAESERRFRQTADLLPVIIIECDLEMCISYINRLGLESFGYSEDEMVGSLKVTGLVDAQLHGELLKRVELMHQGREVPPFEILYRRKGGSEFYGLANCAPITNDGRIIGVRSAVLDITESKKSLQALRESETRYRTLFENIHDFYCVHDLDGKLLDVNPAVGKAFGIDPPDLVGRYLVEFMPSALKTSFHSEYITQIEQEGTSEGVFTVVGFDGKEHYLEYRNVLIEQEGEEPYIVAVGRDITERILSQKELRRLQIQLQQSQKMEAVGTLAGGVAHDFNNILQAISGYAEVLERSVEVDPMGQGHLRAISDAVERASGLVQQLLTFSRKGEPELVAVDINAEVRQTIEMLARTIPKMIDIELELDPEAKLVRADANQLGQILLNLGANARDAMPEGGKLRISTNNLHAEENFFEGNVLVKAGDYVVLGVEDSGNGMTQQEMIHIYDPFFTTKPMGKGTGLGLSMVFGIVKSHKGYISCQSEKGKGTRFNVYLPCQTGAAQAERKQGHKRKAEPADLGGMETILLVDDEKPILNTLKTVVESYGYHTLTAGNGERALEIAAEAGGQIDLVIMDLGMPGMGGLACMRKLHEMRPELKVIVASGYSQHGPFETLIAEGAAAYIKKPFAIADLMDKIRTVLEPTR